MSRSKIKSAIFFPTGQVAVFDERGQQIPELQKPLLLIWAEQAARLGYDPTTLIVETPAGMVKFFKIENGYNWQIL